MIRVGVEGAQFVETSGADLAQNLPGFYKDPCKFISSVTF